MSTSTVLPTLKQDLSWLQRHERLLIVLLVLVAGTWGLGKYLGSEAAIAKGKQAVAEAALAAAKDQAAKDAATVSQVESQYQAMVQTLTAQNSALATAVAQRDAGLAGQQGKDKALPLPELAKRWQTLANVKDTDISATSAGISVTSEGAVQTVITLEEVPVLQADLKDQKAATANAQLELGKSQEVITALGSQVGNLNVELQKQGVACKAEVTAAKAVGRRNSFKWFLRGFITGFIGGTYTGHAL